jgi:hypothetical protein
MQRTVLRRCDTFVCADAWLHLFSNIYNCRVGLSGLVYCTYGCLDLGSRARILWMGTATGQNVFLCKAERAATFLNADIAAMRRHAGFWWQEDGERNGKQFHPVIIRVDGCLSFITSVCTGCCLSVLPSLTANIQAIYISLETVSMQSLFVIFRLVLLTSHFYENKAYCISILRGTVYWDRNFEGFNWTLLFWYSFPSPSLTKKILDVMPGFCKCCFMISWRNAANRLCHTQNIPCLYFYDISFTVIVHGIYVFIQSEISCRVIPLVNLLFFLLTGNI